MGFHKNFHMENSKKIGIIIIFSLFLIGCKNKPLIKEYPSIKNHLFLKYIEDGYLIFKNFSYSKGSNQMDSYIKDDSIHFKTVIYNNKEVKIKDIVDASTFDLLWNDSNDRNKVQNNYYLKDDNNLTYFKDKNYFYIFYEELFNMENPEYNLSKFFIAGKSNDYEVLGGMYVRVGNFIYYIGKKIENADPSTFKTFKVYMKYSEWQNTVAADSANIYDNARKIDYQEFKEMFFLDSRFDSLKKIYFPNN